MTTVSRVKACAHVDANDSDTRPDDELRGKSMNSSRVIYFNTIDDENSSRLGSSAASCSTRETILLE